MARCPSCNAEVPASTRWCGICHTYVVNPRIGRLASPGKRLGALVLDTLIRDLPILLIFSAMGLLGGVGAAIVGENRAGGAVALAFLFGFVLFVAYIVWALRLFARGTSPGKKLLGMRVIREDGQNAGFLTMLIRECVGKAISELFFGLGFLWILFDRDNQGWHDKLVSTYVVEAKPVVPERPRVVICPECGAENQPDARFCKHCGAKLPIAQE